MESINGQYTDPKVSEVKYNREIEQFRMISKEWNLKGVFLIHDEFPVVEFIFTVPKLKPSSIVFAVRIDFSNYDTEPLSLKFIDPFTKHVLIRKEIPMNFWQFKYPPIINNNVPLELQVHKQDLLQGTPDMVPFFCIRGVKEYHDHPYHTGDSWMLYRGTGIGNLNYLLDQLYNHSIININGHAITLTPAISGFNLSIPAPL